MSQRLALIIGNSLYRDDTLSRLISTDADVGAFADALLDPDMGGFDDVKQLVNMASHTVRREIFNFFARKKRTDLLLFYFSGHGVLDDRGRLYLALKDTDTKSLRGTAIPANYITEEMDNSRSRRQVLILDCCHSGAFARGSKGAPGASVGTASAFEGSGFGRVVLTASDATQYAWEGNQVIGEAENSLFTHFIVQGIQSGEADANRDGKITIDELYDYVYTRILDETPKQTPGKWSFKEQGELIISHSPAIKPPMPPVDPKLEKLYTDGLSAYWLEDWGKACRNFEAILEIDPDYQDVSKKLDDARFHKENEELYRQAIKNYEDGRLSESIKSFEELISKIPNYKDAKAKLEKIRNEQNLAKLYSEARKLFDSGKFEAVIQIIQKTTDKYPDFEDTAGFLEKAKIEIKEMEQIRILEDHYSQAILELDAGRLGEAKNSLLHIQKKRKGYRDTEKLLKRIDTLIKEEAERKTKEKTTTEKSAKVERERKTKKTPKKNGISVWGWVGIGVVIIGISLAGIVLHGQPASEPAATFESTATSTPTFTSTTKPIYTPSPIPILIDKESEKIAFVSCSGGLTSCEIYLTNPEGSVFQQLTDNNSEDNFTALSPDGSKIAFVSTSRQYSIVHQVELVVMDIYDGGIHRISSEIAYGTRPAWSPDGTRIAFFRDYGGGKDIVVINPDGTNLERIVDHEPPMAEVESLSWSPDGSKISYVEDVAIYIINSDGSGVNWLTEHDCVHESPAWSPDGTRIAFSSNQDGDFEIYIINPDRSDIQQLTDNEWDDQYPAWSPDGSKIVYSSNPGKQWGTSELYIMNADGSGIQQLTDNDSLDCCPSWSR